MKRLLFTMLLAASVLSSASLMAEEKPKSFLEQAKAGNVVLYGVTFYKDQDFELKDQQLASGIKIQVFKFTDDGYKQVGQLLFKPFNDFAAALNASYEKQKNILSKFGSERAKKSLDLDSKLQKYSDKTAKEQAESILESSVDAAIKLDAESAPRIFKMKDENKKKEFVKKFLKKGLTGFERKLFKFAVKWNSSPTVKGIIGQLLAKQLVGVVASKTNGLLSDALFNSILKDYYALQTATLCPDWIVDQSVPLFGILLSKISTDNDTANQVISVIKEIVKQISVVYKEIIKDETVRDVLRSLVIDKLGGRDALLPKLQAIGTDLNFNTCPKQVKFASLEKLFGEDVFKEMYKQEENKGIALTDEQQEDEVVEALDDDAFFEE